MAEETAVDHKRLGIDPQYNPAQQQKIRRLMLEDWQKAGVKLPTYMKLVARYIADTGAPEEWLAKLSHQTMDKMLKSVSTPRYEFWACLHLYLSKKYADLSISETAPTETQILGEALVRFGKVSDSVAANGAYSLNGETNTALALVRDQESPYHRVYQLRRFHSDEPFADPVVTTLYGAGVVTGSTLVAVLRTISREITSLEVALSALTPLDDETMLARLDALRDAS